MGRVVITIVIGLAIVGAVRTWIYTGANSVFPKESELAQGNSGRVRSGSLTDDEVPDKGVLPAKVSVPPVAPSEGLQQRVLRLRNEVKGNIVPFSSAEMLENSLFQEFLNLGEQPLAVKVEALRVRGSLDKDSRRPVLANLKVEFQGVRGDDSEERMTRFEDRLLTAWLVLGKYATLGKVSLDEVHISVREPTPWDERYEGRFLAGLWTGSIPPEQLFMR